MEAADGRTISSCALRSGDGSRHSRCRFHVLKKPILGTAYTEYWYRTDIRGFLLEIPQTRQLKVHRRATSPGVLRVRP